MDALRLSPGEKLFTEIRSMTFRKETFEYVHTCIVDENGECWTTTGLDEANIYQVYNAYRAKHGIPFPDELIALREFYGLSAAKMSEILGFGINQYRLYEDGEVPCLSNARTLMSIRNKNVFIDYLNASREMLGEKDYARILKKVSALGEFNVLAGRPSVLSGYKSLSMEKVSAAVHFFIHTLGGVFVTKMNKLLFYADFLCYRRHGFGLTGLEYVALPFGPVPDSWAKIYGSLDHISLDEYIFPNMTSGIKLEADLDPDLTILSENELSILTEIAEMFRHTSAGAISEKSHHEKGWQANKDRKGNISYTYAFDLSIA